MELQKVFHPAELPTTGLAQRSFEIFHPLARALGARLHVFRPSQLLFLLALGEIVTDFKTAVLLPDI